MSSKMQNGSKRKDVNVLRNVLPKHSELPYLESMSLKPPPRPDFAKCGQEPLARNAGDRGLTLLLPL